MFGKQYNKLCGQN